ncbi:MAG: hypothetical protein E7429_06140 [Ruminococcaceae bacterium]|nr:hypothetical protein [Oscillospiraceae bacterium]
MGENWLGIWAFFFIGLLVIAIAVYDGFDRKKRDQKIKVWKYLAAVVAGLVLMFPILSGVVLWLLGLPL